MLCLVMLSLGATFAADDNVTDVIAVDDEIAIDEEVLAVEEDVQALSESESIIVTNDNLADVVSPDGGINENITADELIFKGTFEDLNLSVGRPIKVTGDEAVLINPDILIGSSNVTFSGFTINQTKHINALFIGGLEDDPISDVTISNVKIDFKDIGEAPANIAVEAVNVNFLNLINNAINYVGATDGSYVNNAISLRNSNGSIISGNKFNISLVSCYVPWSEVPTGSGNWVSAPVSEGIVVDSSEGVQLRDNTIDVTYNNVVGKYDTIYAVSFKGADYTLIENNTINAFGHTYIYGIILSGEHFNINNNVISSESDVYYANGIDIEGPASGVVDSNNISVKGVQSAYAIYSGMNGFNVTGYYIDNNIKAEAYNVFGMSLGDIESQIINNTLDLAGNYTTGIAYRGSDANVTGNHIILASSEVGNESVWEGFGVEAVGVKVIKGDVSISDNVIAGPGKGIYIVNASADIENNFVNTVANNDKNAIGIDAENTGKLIIYNNTVDYQGTTKGSAINNAVYLYNATDAIISNNIFDLELVSCYVPWAEIPSGSGNWVSYPVSEGIVVEGSNGVIFESNKVNVTLGDVVGSYDTIYVVDFKNSNGAVIANNAIDAVGETYIYGIIISGDDFIIRSNNITSIGNYYANGIDIEGPAASVVENNVINVKANTSVYGIYSGMNGADVKANYTKNTVTGSAYNVFGFSLGDVESNLVENEIDLTGNYTTGIAYRGSAITIDNNRIILTSSEVGNETIWEGFGVEAVGVKIIKGNATISNSTIVTSGKGISLTGDAANVNVENNFINVVANDDKDAFAIRADDVPNLVIHNNTVDYQGTTKGTGINYAVYLGNATDALIFENTFDLELVSSYVPWFEIPAGSGKWESFPISEGIVVEASNGVIFDSNIVNVTLGDVVGSYDTIYVVDFRNSDEAVIALNDIDAVGETYIYGILMSGDDFVIRANDIATKGNYYANGIDIEGPASGVVDDNTIDVKANTSAYAIYSGMNGADVSANYTKNLISGDAYNVFGFSLGDVDSNVTDNIVLLTGNYTTGIASAGSKLNIEDNFISAVGSNVGNESIWESFGVETVGVKIASGNAVVINNEINSTGEFAVKLADTVSSVHDNILISDKLKGDIAVDAFGDAEIYNNTPINNNTKSVLAVWDINMQVGDGSQYVVVLKDENNKALTNKTVYVKIGDSVLNDVTDEKGVAKFDLNLDIGNYTAIATFKGDENFTRVKSFSDIIVTEVVPTRIDTIITVDAKFSRVATDYYAGERGDFFYAILTDINGNPLVNKTVQIAVNGPIYNVTTDEQGRAGLQVNLAAANTYTYALSFQGDDQYNAAPLASSKLTVTKKSTSITAANKAF
ncbi:beta strand repeat-containing protein, partial [Methanobrevibacter sp.]|uniref:beta strand repeat-containing protein n=1 Tax=Methanobrevibacter sp. TaxID=66852 RepID=UPI00386436AD